jgi:hypothetical protein
MMKVYYFLLMIYDKKMICLFIILDGGSMFVSNYNVLFYDQLNINVYLFIISLYLDVLLLFFQFF